jgi:hypothetical protein
LNIDIVPRVDFMPTRYKIMAKSSVVSRPQA